MQNSIRAKGLLPLSGALLVAAGVLISGAASAQDFNGEFGVATENAAKGLGKSGGDPSVSAAVGVSYDDVYAEVSGSSVDIAQGADTEIIATVGYAPKIGAYSLDLSAMHRTLIGSPAGYDDVYMEYQADASRKVGPVGLRMRVNYSPDGSGSAQEAWWVELQGGVALDSRSRATVALGERTIDGGNDYVAWNVGVKRKLTDALALDVRWYDTDSHAFGERYEGRLVAALTFSL